MNAQKQRTVGFLAGGGCLLALLGFFMIPILVGAGMMRMEVTGGKDPSQLIVAGISLVFVVLGLAGVVTGIIYGIMAARSGVSKQEYRFPNCFVISKFAENSVGETVFDVYEGENEDYKYFVQLQLATGKKEEFRCVYSVFLCAGEGMRGEAVAQGNWMSQFVPYIGPAGASQRPGTL